MSDESSVPNDTKSTATFIWEIIPQYVDRCIKCHRCMDVCPVTKGEFSIDYLNQATLENQPVPSVIQKFAFHCTQCGKCVPVCPVIIRRDYMVRAIKSKLRNSKPWRYRRYLLVKGPDLTGLKNILQKLFVFTKKITQPDLASYMEKTPVKKADVLFYPGCYMYSKETMRQTLRLLHHIDCSFAVLGGVTTCCGAPYLLQGDFDKADHCLRLLYEKIKAVEPKVILTACAECFEAVEDIKKRYNEDFEVLTVIQYLLRNKQEFPKVKIKGKTMVHDSCRFTKGSPQGLAARTAVDLFGKHVEYLSLQGSVCCFQWNHGYDSDNVKRQKEYLVEVKKSASTLACNCLTCYEELKKIKTDVEIIDTMQLFIDALDATQSKERKP
jgi:heterodisulfide reductase subunit D